MTDPANDDDDNRSPAEIIVDRLEDGESEPITALVMMLGEIATALWLTSASVDELVEMAKADVHRVKAGDKVH